MDLESMVFVTLRFFLKGARHEIVDTNIKRELLGDFLSEAVRSQFGQGEDNSPAVERDAYNITVACDLSSDTFSFKSDCGNLGLMTGILMHVSSAIVPA